MTLCDPVDYSLPGSSVHGIFQARVLEWVAPENFPSVDQSACVVGFLMRRCGSVAGGMQAEGQWPLSRWVRCVRDWIRSCLRSKSSEPGVL